MTGGDFDASWGFAHPVPQRTERDGAAPAAQPAAGQPPLDPRHFAGRPMTADAIEERFGIRAADCHELARAGLVHRRRPAKGAYLYDPAAVAERLPVLDADLTDAISQSLHALGLTISCAPAKGEPHGDPDTNGTRTWRPCARGALHVTIRLRGTRAVQLWSTTQDGATVAEVWLGPRAAPAVACAPRAPDAALPPQLRTPGLQQPRGPLQELPGPTPGGLPAGWLRLQDHRGCDYYVDPATGRSQWEHPAAAVGAAGAPTLPRSQAPGHSPVDGERAGS